MLATGLPDIIMTDDNNSSVTRRKLLGSMAIVGAASAGAGAGTYAYITDNETASFSFQAGSILLKTDPSTVNFTAEEGAQDDGSEMSDTIHISNLGTLDVGTLELSSVSLSDEAESDLRQGARVTTLTFTQPDGEKYDLTTDPNQSLAELASEANSSGITLGEDDPILTPGGGSASLEIGITYDYSEVTSNGGTLDANFEFSATQSQQG